MEPSRKQCTDPCSNVSPVLGMQAIPGLDSPKSPAGTKSCVQAVYLGSDSGEEEEHLEMDCKGVWKCH